MVVASGWGRGSGELVLDGYRGLVWEDENVLEMVGGNGCPTVYLMPLKNG